MKLPKEFLLEVLDSIFSIKNTADDDEIHIDSPFIKDAKSKCYINLEKQVFNCFKSGECGSMLRFFSLYFEIPKYKVIEYLVEHYGMQNEIDFSLSVEEKKEEGRSIYEVIESAKIKWLQKDKIGIIGKNAIRYLKERKIDNNYIRKCGYGFDPNTNFFNRIIMPFFEDGALVYFAARSMEKENKLRYLNIPSFSSKEFLFNYDEVISNSPLVICEGIFDAMSINNYPATALMSADISKFQIQKINEKGVKDIIIVKDNDETGERTLLKNIEKIYYNSLNSVETNIYLYSIPRKYKDANEYRVDGWDGNIDINECVKYEKNKYFPNWEF
jgi:DNA primase